MSNPMREIARAMDKRSKQSRNTKVFVEGVTGPSSGDPTHNHDDRYIRAITKSSIEAVLTGEISSHTHAISGGASKSLKTLTTGSNLLAADSGKILLLNGATDIDVYMPEGADLLNYLLCNIGSNIVDIYKAAGEGIPTTNLVALYNFSSNANDTMGSFNPTSQSGITYEVGKVGNSAKFNGSAYAVISRPVTSDFTIAFWFKSTQGIGTGTDWWTGAGLVDGEIGGYTDDMGISLNSDGRILIGIHSDYRAYTRIGFNDGNWHHVCLVRNKAAGTTYLYVDNVLEASITGGYTGDITANANLNIGRLNTSSNYFVGNLDQLMFYTRALSDAERLTIFESTSEGLSTPAELIDSLDTDESIELWWDISSSTWVTVDSMKMQTSGTGDMTKAIYDTDNDGIVDTAENALAINGKTVDLTGVADGDILYYDSASGKIKAKLDESGGASVFTSLTDAPASYTGQGGKVVAVKSTADGLEFVNSGQATNGLPAGGTAGQILSKIDGTNYNAQWVDASSGGIGTPSGDGTEDTNPDTLAESSSSYTGSISFMEILISFWLASIKFYVGATGGNITVNLRNAGGQLLATKTIATTSSAWNTFTFDSPVKLTAKDYIVVEVLMSSQKLWRKTSTLYSGTLWKQKSHRVNDFFTGSAYSETPGLGLIEYNG